MYARCLDIRREMKEKLNLLVKHVQNSDTISPMLNVVNRNLIGLNIGEIPTVSNRIYFNSALDNFIKHEQIYSIVYLQILTQK